MSTAGTTASVPDLLLFGGTGLLGSAIRAAATGTVESTCRQPATSAASGDTWHAVELRDGGDAAAALIDARRPRAVINAAYINRGDDLGAVTGDAPGAIAAACIRVGARLVHVSSDVVFAGTKAEPYREDDPVGPVHDYARAKVRAEQGVAAADPSAVMVRTSLLWGGSGDGGPQVRLTADPTVTFFTDEIRNPLRVDRLALACLELVARPDIQGVLHVAGEDAVDRLTFARAVAPLAGVDPTSLSGRPGDPDAARPARIELDSGLARTLLASPLPGIVADAPPIAQD